MKKIKLRYVWISIALAFIIAIALFFVVPQTTGNWTTVVKVVLVILFIYITLAVQYASFQAFRYKAKKQVYPKAYYETDVTDIHEKLKSLKFEERETNYGFSFLRINGKTANKVVLVNDATKYFDQNEEEDKNYKPNKKLENCNIFVAFEIFFDYDATVLEKLPEFSIQGNKVYYTAFSYNKDENQYECHYDLTPDDQFLDAYNSLINDLGFRKIEKI